MDSTVQILVRYKHLNISRNPKANSRSGLQDFHFVHNPCSSRLRKIETHVVCYVLQAKSTINKPHDTQCLWMCKLLNWTSNSSNISSKVETTVVTGQPLSLAWGWGKAGGSIFLAMSFGKWYVAHASEYTKTSSRGFMMPWFRADKVVTTKSITHISVQIPTTSIYNHQPERSTVTAFLAFFRKTNVFLYTIKN